MLQACGDQASAFHLAAAWVRLAQLPRIMLLMLLMPLSLSAPGTLLGQRAWPAPLQTLARCSQLALLVRCGRGRRGWRLKHD